MRSSRVLAFAVSPVLAAAGCWRSAPPVAVPFEVARTVPSLGGDAPPLLLNDSLTVYFTAPIEPISVTADSVTVFDSEGHPVPGELATGNNWVSFTPLAPLKPDLRDGSFLAGESYRLVVAGYPRPDAIRARDGRRLGRVGTFPVRMAPRGPVEVGGERFPEPLRPPGGALPLLLRGNEAAQQLAADAPVLQLHFTAPILPTSVRPEAIVVQLLTPSPGERLVPRSVRLVRTRLDRFPGSTVEVDLGPSPRRAADGTALALAPGDRLSVTLAQDEHALRDYAGERVLPAPFQWWEVQSGSSVALLDWPEGEGGVTGDDPWLPGFEARWGVVRPQVRAEAGSGVLGVFHPNRATVLRPGQPFDRGDGTIVQSVGQTFPFLAVDIPAGVEARLEGEGSRLLSCGGIHIGGDLLLDGGSLEIPSVPHGVPVEELLGLSPLSLVAAGDIVVTGRVATVLPLPSERSALTVAAAGRIHLYGELPYNTMLAVEADRTGAVPAPRIVGSRGQTFTRSVTFTAEPAPGAVFRCEACTPWRRLPDGRDGGVVRFVDVDPRFEVRCQTAPPDPLTPTRPDRRAGRRSRPRIVRHGDPLGVAPGRFVRFCFSVEVHGGEGVLPELRQLRLTDR